jgi:SAM-dependent methyltransferase
LHLPTRRLGDEDPQVPTPLENDGEPLTASPEYAERLRTLSGARWKQYLDVQRPYRAHVRHLRLGRTLDVGCGTGRNLRALDPGSLGVDHNPSCVEVARRAGCQAVTTEEFLADPELQRPAQFDSMLVAHVLEHMRPDEARQVVKMYLDLIRPGGRVVLITPQERGFASDATHVSFTDAPALRSLAEDVGLTPERDYSFPLPRFMGKLFTYNEFVLLARTQH